MKTFEVGKKYTMRSVCDYNCTWTFQVVKRTAATVTLKGDFMNGVKVKTCRINKKLAETFGEESVMPLGSYSMAPILSAR